MKQLFLTQAWEGGLILKNSLFPTKLMLTEGEIDVVDQLMKVRPHNVLLLTK
jgi:hypothetical protein